MVDYNSMQANLGLVPGAGPSMQLKSPAQAAAELSQQASMQMQQAQQVMGMSAPVTSAFTFGQQYQRQFGSAQDQSSYGVHMAGMLSSFTQPSTLPSPLLMTPAHTGVFRPPMPGGSGAGGAPLSPMPIMPMVRTPFTPEFPTPSFRTPWEMEIQQRELRADMIYSTSMQTPRAAGMGAGYGMGALAGAALGARFGPAGRGIGAMAGGLAAHMSGFAGGLGEMAMFPMRPQIEAHSMGLAAQRMSQDWVVGGPNLHTLGRGLSRDASLSLGQGLQDMASDSGFKRETRGMFNRHDLMKITQQSGQQGLLDFDQSVGDIQSRVKDISRTLMRYMELTNDPDVTSVIRRMGQMRSFGMSLPEIEQAASHMRTFARAAGTTTEGLWQQGLPGAMTYQSLGLSGGSGLQYGMYSAAMARQAVASGTFTEAQLAQLGGVQGVAQRNMQAQGALMSMPLMGAAVGSYGPGGWGLSGNNLANMSQGTPQGMVMGAVSNMNAAMQSGGIGALAMMPLQQRFVQDQAARAMTPYDQTAMRFSLASNTGSFLGMSGAGGFAAGARVLYGNEVAEQMLLEASNPEYWKSQKKMIQQERDTLARQQRQDIMDAAPGVFDRINFNTPAVVRRALGAMDEIPAAAKRAWRDTITRPLQEQSDRAAGIISYDELDPDTSADLSSAEGRAAYKSRARYRKRGGRGSGGFHATGRDTYDMFMRAGGGDDNSDVWGGMIQAGIGILNPLVGGADLGLNLAGVDTQGLARTATGGLIQGGVNAAGGMHTETFRQLLNEDARVARTFKGAAGRRMTGGAAGEVYSNLEKHFGLTEGQGIEAMFNAGRALARRAESKSGVFVDGTIDEGDIQQSIADALAEVGGGDAGEYRKKLVLFTAQYQDLTEQALAGASTMASAGGKEILRKTEEGATGRVKRSDLARSRSEIERLKTVRKAQIYRSFGLGGSDREELIKALSRRSPEEMLAIGINAQGGRPDPAQMQRLQRAVAARDGVDANSREAREAAYALLESVGVGGLSGDTVSAIGQAGGEEYFKQIDALTSATAGIQHAELAQGVFGDIATATGSMVDSYESLIGMDSEGIRGLQGSRKYQALGNLLAKHRKSSGAERVSIEGAIDEQLVSLGGTTGGAESLVGATGEQARRLEASDILMSETAEKMSEAFRHFNATTTKQFQDAVSIFHDAVVIGKQADGTIKTG